MPRMNAVVFLTSFEPGGTERQMIELARRLDRQRFEVHLACFHRSGAWRERAEEAVSSVAEFPIPGFAHPGALRQAFSFARWCRELGADVVQACDLYTNVFALPAAAAAGVPVRIGSRRGFNPDRSFAHRLAQRAALRLADRVVCNSRAAALHLARAGTPPARISVIPNGLDLSGFRPVERSGPVTRVGTLARLHPVKGLDTLVEAVALLAPEMPQLTATIAGEGPERGALERQISRLGLAGRVLLTGHRDEVATVLGGLDLFVLPSRSEAFPNALVEAMASALPVVATSVGGVPEIVENGRTGILVPPDRPELLADAIRQLARRPDEARALGQRGRDEVAARYSFERAVSQFEALYAEIAAGKRLPARPAPREAATR